MGRDVRASLKQKSNKHAMVSALAGADIIILGAPPSVYQSLTFPLDKQVADVWNFWTKSGTAVGGGGLGPHNNQRNVLTGCGQLESQR